MQPRNPRPTSLPRERPPEWRMKATAGASTSTNELALAWFFSHLSSQSWGAHGSADRRIRVTIVAHVIAAAMSDFKLARADVALVLALCATGGNDPHTVPGVNRRVPCCIAIVVFPGR